MDQKMKWKLPGIDGFRGKQPLFILLLVGLLLVVIAMPSEKTTEQKKEEVSISSGKSQPIDRYATELETRLSDLLEEVHGVGKNKVMITLKSTAEKVVEKDRETGEDSVRETTVYGETNEEESPYVKKEMTPTIEGVIVIAEGGDDPVAVKNITEAVQALFAVDTHKIKVMKMNEN